MISATLFRPSSSFWTTVVDVEQDDKLLSWFSISIIMHDDHEDKKKMMMITVGNDDDDDDNMNDDYNDGFCQR